MARVLVVDDQKIPRVSVAAMLGEAGHEVATEAGGADGLARAREWGPDVIVLDVHMPEMDGFAVVEQLKRDSATAAIPVIFLTATSQTDDLLVRGLDLGAYDFLSKGCSKSELLARVGVMARIKRGTDELSAIARIADALIRTLDPDELSQVFLRQTREIFRARAALLVLPSDNGAGIYAAEGFDSSDPLFDRLVEALLAATAAGSEHNEPLAIEELRGPAGVLVRRNGLQSIISTPLRPGDGSPGLLAVFAEREDGFRRESDTPLLELLARQAMIALDNALLHARTREQARLMAEQAEALEQAMSERSRFFASMSHELRTPVNAVIGYNQLLEEGTYGELTPTQVEVLGKVARSARNLLELINDILDISKIEAGKIEIRNERTNLPVLIRDTLTSIQLQAAAKELDLRVEVPEDLVLDTDPARLRQILLNLLSNAVKFTDHGGVTIHVELLERTAASPAPWVHIEVADTGPGIAPEDQHRVFEEFEQVDMSMRRGGTGLGLAISRKLAQLLGGTLSLQSEVGVGSRFLLQLPTSPPGQAPE